MKERLKSIHLRYSNYLKLIWGVTNSEKEFSFGNVCAAGSALF